tara:strand:+ start:3899 stop:4207 length:309 start_codon:yes stop_codon:yes gene_type:complete
MNIKTQIKDISNRCKDTFTHTIDDLSEKYDNIYYYNKYHNFYKGQLDITRQIKAKVSLATALFRNSISKIDISKASLGYSDFIIHNNEELDELRRKKGNSNK